MFWLFAVLPIWFLLATSKPSAAAECLPQNKLTGDDMRVGQLRDKCVISIERKGTINMAELSDGTVVVYSTDIQLPYGRYVENSINRTIAMPDETAATECKTYSVDNEKTREALDQILNLVNQTGENEDYDKTYAKLVDWEANIKGEYRQAAYRGEIRAFFRLLEKMPDSRAKIDFEVDRIAEFGIHNMSDVEKSHFSGRLINILENLPYWPTSQENLNGSDASLVLTENGYQYNMPHPYNRIHHVYYDLSREARDNPKIHLALPYESVLALLAEKGINISRE